ncbi:MAG: hypothetical protein MJZ86_09125 [Bacteroidales bacterium]|nr:hypothetical protein [Bacteroidales bacterium]
MEWVAIVISLVGVGVAVWAAISSSRSAQKQIEEVHHASVKASEEAQKQISAITQLLDVFMIANTPQILEIKHKYELDLNKIKSRIVEVKEKSVIVRYPWGYRNITDEIDDREQGRKFQEQLSELNSEKERLEYILNILQEFLKRNAERE